MSLWKRNLIVCWIGMFFTGIGVSQIMPVLPIYIRHLGVHNNSAVAQFSGIAFGITFIASAIFSPIWGSLADKVGRKPMLIRASLGMAIVIFCMGFSPNVYVLIFLRLLQGTITGYSTACTALIATQTDKSHSGFALGTLSTANVSGSLLGPMFGGFVCDHFGVPPVFLITGSLIFVSLIVTILFVKEDFNPQVKKKTTIKEVWNMVPEKQLTAMLFLVFFMVSLGLYTIEPIVTVYVGQLAGKATNIAFLAGLAFSASGLSNIIAAPQLGKLSDKIGPHKIILIMLIVSGLVYIPQAFVRNVYELILLRFILGISFGGLNPSINILLKKITPDAITGRMFGLSMTMTYAGVFAGSILGGQIAGLLGVKYVFIVTSILLFVNALIVYFKVYKNLKEKII